jgi:hypothetical protein
MPWQILPNPHNTKLARELARRDSVAAPSAPERRDFVHERLVRAPAGTQLGMRKVREVIPGWPLARWILTCGHGISVNTSYNGRIRPRPPNRMRCHECLKTLVP